MRQLTQEAPEAWEERVRENIREKTGWKLDTASSLPCTLTSESADVHQLSQDGRRTICNSSIFAWRAHKELYLLQESQLRRTETTGRYGGKMGRCFTFSWASQRVECSWGGFIWWTLKIPYRVFGEILISLFLLLFAATAKRFLLWMFGSNQSLPDTLSLQIITCLYLFPAATKPNFTENHFLFCSLPIMSTASPL